MNKLILISTLALILVVSQTDGINIFRHVIKLLNRWFGDQQIKGKFAVDVKDIIRILRDEQLRKMKDEKVIEKKENEWENPRDVNVQLE